MWHCVTVTSVNTWHVTSCDISTHRVHPPYSACRPVIRIWWGPTVAPVNRLMSIHWRPGSVFNNNIILAKSEPIIVLNHNKQTRTKYGWHLFLSPVAKATLLPYKVRILLKSFGWVIVQKPSDGYSSSNWCHIVNLWTSAAMLKICPSLFSQRNKMPVISSRIRSKSFSSAVTNAVFNEWIVNFLLFRWRDHRAWGLSTPACPSLAKWDSTKMSASRGSPRRWWRPSPFLSRPRTSSLASVSSSPTSRPQPQSRR